MVATSARLNNNNFMYVIKKARIKQEKSLKNNKKNERKDGDDDDDDHKSYTIHICFYTTRSGCAYTYSFLHFFCFFKRTKLKQNSFSFCVYSCVMVDGSMDDKVNIFISEKLVCPQQTSFVFCAHNIQDKGVFRYT